MTSETRKPLVNTLTGAERRRTRWLGHALATATIAFGALCCECAAQVAVKGRVVYTMDGGTEERIENGVVVITDGKIAAVGRQGEVAIPAGHRVLECDVVTPGIIDAHCTVGVSGILNQRQDQDQLERSSAAQPELRAIDAYNPHDRLVAYVRSLGITTIHTGHAPGELISGQTAVVKTAGNTVEEAVVVESAAVACTLGPGGQHSGGPPGTRSKLVAMLRDELVKTREYIVKAAQGPTNEADEADAGKDKKRGPQRDLHKETLARVLRKELPLLITCNRAQDIASALRVAKEFDIRIILDGASESYLLLDEIKAAGVPVISHPEMMRAFGEMENMSMETPATLRKAGIPVALQGGYESYVPKARVVVFEAAIAAANGMTLEEALATITRDAARILGVEARVGALKVGLDGDVALFDGDPFEYTTRCVGTVIEGKIVFEGAK